MLEVTFIILIISFFTKLIAGIFVSSASNYYTVASKLKSGGIS